MKIVPHSFGASEMHDFSSTVKHVYFAVTGDQQR